jgi:filamentous hemagglutinin family protein
VFKAISSCFGLTLCILGYFCATNNPASAQVTSDDTVNTQVTEKGNTAEITGGETRGDNLFHSFQDFSVGIGNEAAFLNANEISNIFSRVTGGDISNIDGLISANGSANLFLINPAGIIFGENARLDVGGSFYGSTADSILFEDGEFSATDLDNPPLLTINAPIGLNLRDNPAGIVNRSVVLNDAGDEAIGLEVAPGNNLAFIGGDINFEVGGEATAQGGNIELGGLSAEGTVGINPDGSFSFPEAVARADVNLQDAAEVDVTGTGGGNITINARNFNLEAGEFNGAVFASRLLAGITADSTSPKAQAGDITINATESVNLDNSYISNTVTFDAIGNAGNLNITTPNLSLTNLSSIKADTLGQGNAGFVDINATKLVTLNDSSISSTISFGGVGDGGEVNITTPNLSLANFSSIDADIYGQGNAGLIDINATKLVTLDDISSISSTVGSNAIGNGGVININTPNLSLTNSGSIEANAYGAGNGNGGLIDINATESVTLNESSISSTAGFDEETNNGGEININTPNLSLTNSGSIDANAYGAGNAGLININATESVTFNESSISNTVGVDEKGNAGEVNINTPNFSLFSSSIDVGTFGQGKAGKLTITSANISLTDLSSISADTFAEKDGGSIDINASESITLDNSDIKSRVTFDAKGNGGKLNITTPNLFLTNDSGISASTGGQGDAGLININATESTTLNNNSFITSSVNEGAEGNSGDLNITTPNLFLTNESIIFAASLGQGDAGLIDINADTVALDNSVITAQALKNANGGNLKIDADVIVAFPGKDSDIRASAEQGKGGNITINADSVLGIEQRPLNDSTNDINASSQVTGLDGFVKVDASDVNPIQGATELPSNVVELQQNTANACEAGRGTANNGLAIAGKGGVPPAPDTPLNSENIITSEQNPAAFAIPQPIETSQGKIQPARGIKVTKSGKIVLTAYRTNNAGERIPEIKPNCN